MTTTSPTDRSRLTPSATASSSSTPSQGRLTRTLPLLAGPVLLFVGYAFHPDLPADTSAALLAVEPVRGTYLAAKVAVAIGSLLMILLVVAIRRRAVPGRGRGLATAAVALTGVAMVSNALSQAVFGYLLWFVTEPGVDHVAAVAVVQAGETADLMATAPISFLSMQVFALGLILLALALWRAGTVPRWVPVAIMVTDIAAGAIGLGPLMAAVGAVAVAAFWVALTPRRESVAVGS